MKSETTEKIDGSICPNSSNGQHLLDAGVEIDSDNKMYMRCIHCGRSGELTIKWQDMIVVGSASAKSVY